MDPQPKLASLPLGRQCLAYPVEPGSELCSLPLLAQVLKGG